MASRRKALGLVVLLVLLGTVTLIAVSRLRQPLRVTPEHQLLVFEVPTEIEEVPPSLLPLSLDAFRREQPTLRDVCEGIRRASGDDAIRALVLPASVPG